jgi:precorrin-6Y C5,15-methyltransferase (decarboxylating)
MCDNINIIKGEAPEALNNLPSPACVFIGGSNGKISEITRLVYEKSRDAVIVITAVSLETLADCQSAFESNGISAPEIIQVAVTRTKKIGRHTMLSAENPVFIIAGVRK